MRLAAFAAVALCLAGLASWIRPQINYARERTAGYEVMLQLPDRRPQDVPVKAWEVAATWAITAYANVCFSDDHVSMEELRRFRNELEARIAGNVDLATIDWIWQRLGETGSHGKQYRERFEPQYRENLTAALTK
jgi:hypothetical protein